MLELSKDIRQAQLDQSGERLAFGRTAKNGLTPFLRVVYIRVGRRDIEITQNHEFFMLPNVGRTNASQRRQPVTLGRVLRGTKPGTVRKSSIDYADVA